MIGTALALYNDARSLRAWNKNQDSIDIESNVARSFGMAVTKMKVRPLGDKVLIKRLEAEDRTAGGIVLPDTAKEKPKQGKVLSLGDGKLLDNGKRASFQVKEGDRVLFTSYGGQEVNVDGEEYLIMTEDDILAVVD